MPIGLGVEGVDPNPIGCLFLALGVLNVDSNRGCSEKRPLLLLGTAAANGDASVDDGVAVAAHNDDLAFGGGGGGATVGTPVTLLFWDA